MLFQVINLLQEKTVPAARASSNSRALPLRIFANRVPRRRPDRQSQRKTQYSSLFFMALIIAVISSVAFLGILSVALGAG